MNSKSIIKKNKLSANSSNKKDNLFFCPRCPYFKFPEVRFDDITIDEFGVKHRSVCYKCGLSGDYINFFNFKCPQNGDQK